MAQLNNRRKKPSQYRQYKERELASEAIKERENILPRNLENLMQDLLMQSLTEASNFFISSE